MMNATDTVVNNYFTFSRGSFGTGTFYILTTIFDFSVHFFLLSVFVSYLLYLIKGKKYSFLFIFSIMTGVSVVYLLKNFFAVDRPSGGIISAFGQSFPSYHATISTIFFVIIMYSLNGYFKGKIKLLFNTICIFIIFLVSLSRVYLGVHWLSDVVFGVIIGLVISSTSIFLFKKLCKNY